MILVTSPHAEKVASQEGTMRVSEIGAPLEVWSTSPFLFPYVSCKGLLQTGSQGKAGLGGV